MRAENQLLQGPLTALESEIAKELDSLRALQSEELSLGDAGMLKRRKEGEKKERKERRRNEERKRG